MRPYLAIIKDSFREALASRVLWILFGLITLVLLALAPLTYHEVTTVGIREQDIPGWPLLVEQLKAGADSSKPSPARRIWSLLSAEAQAKLKDFRGMPDKPTMRDVRELQRTEKSFFASLEEVLKRDDLYDERDWQGVPISRELRELQKTPYNQLSRNDRLRANRLLLESAFPDAIASSPPTSLSFRYAVWDFGQPVPVRKKQFFDGLFKSLPWLIDKGILSIGLLVAVLVTAPIIPQMFDPASLHLLLSKPIGRSFLFLSKFLGGCAFVLLAATYLFIGIWLIIGLQWGVWEPQLLWCIPIYGFVFATYYSVSALAGLIWRNTIVAVILTFLFWASCFSIGVGKNTLGGMIQRYRISRIAPAGENLFAADELNTLLVWQKEKSSWQPLFTSGEHEQFRNAAIFIPVPIGGPIVGPIYDEVNEQLVAAAPSVKMFGRMVMVSAKRAPEWKASEGPPPSGQPIALLREPEGSPLLVTNAGLLRIGGSVAGGTRQIKLPGLSLPLSTPSALSAAGPSPAQYWGDPAASALDHSTGDLYIFSRGRLTLLRRSAGADGNYSVVAEAKINDDEREPAVIAAGGGHCYLAFRSGQIWSVPAGEKLEPARGGKVPGESPPRAALLSSDAQELFILAHDGRLYAQLLSSQHFSAPRLRGQGDISAIAVDAGKLYITSRATRVSEYDAVTKKELRNFSPPLNVQERVYYYGIQPAHAWLPKPGEFYKTVQYLLVGETTSGRDQKDLTAAQDRLDPWSPITSGLIFQVVLLALGCLYIQRQEF